LKLQSEAETPVSQVAFSIEILLKNPYSKKNWSVFAFNIYSSAEDV
jgi:hypothetical protein